MSARELITEHLDLWTGAVTKKSSSGRGSNGKVELTGIKKLRELILELAVRGKLVEQYANDEPASMLLEKIDKDKAQLTQLGNLKKPKKYPQIAPEEHPFKIPSSWIWERMHRVFLKITDGTHHSPPNKEDGDFLYVSAKNIKPEGVQLDGITYVTKGIHEEIYSRCNPELGDLLYIKDGATTGVATINNLDEAFSMLSSVALLKPHRDLLSNKFLLYCLRAPFFYQEMRAGMTGVAITRVTLKKLDLALIPVPPIEEQHRIVQKVDELMALCDQLEQQTSDQLEAHETLVDTLLGTLTQSENATELADNWARLAAHFDTLFTTEQSIDKLKQTILQLAVMGRLVEQDFSSEDSSELLQKIESKREQLVQQGKLKGGDKRNVSEKTDTPFNLPANWSWVRISDLLPDFQNGASSRGDQSGSEVIVLRLADITNLEITLEDPRRLLISNSSISKYAVRKGDILIIRVNGSADLVGRFIPVEAPFDGIFCDHFIRLRIDSQIIEPRFLALVGSTELIRSRIEDLFVSTAGQKTVNQKHIGSLLTSLPPIEEQHRIVKKVDELTALCDQLKERLNQASETRCHLAEAIVEQGLSA